MPRAVVGDGDDDVVAHPALLPPTLAPRACRSALFTRAVTARCSATAEPTTSAGPVAGSGPAQARRPGRAPRHPPTAPRRGTAPRGRRRPARPAGARVRREQQVLEDRGEVRAVRDDAVDVGEGVVGERACRERTGGRPDPRWPATVADLPQAPPQQLRAGAEQGQRRAQLVPGVGDEPALQREHGRQRLQGAPAEPRPGGRGEQQADRACGEHRGQDPAPVVLPWGQVQHGLDHEPVRAPLGHDAVGDPADPVLGRRRWPARDDGGERRRVVGPRGEPACRRRSARRASRITNQVSSGNSPTSSARATVASSSLVDRPSPSRSR